MFRKSLSQLLIMTLVVAGHLLGLGVMFSQAETTPPAAKPAAVMVAALLPPASQAKPAAQVKPKQATPEPKPKAMPKTAPKKIPAKTPAKTVTKTAAKTPAKPVNTTTPSERAISTMVHHTAAKIASNTPASNAIAPPSADAKASQNRAPVYPTLSRKKKEQGTVLLKLLVKADGTVGSISVMQSSGFSRLDQAALQAVKHWRFTPATQQGKNIDYWYEMPMNFALNN
ncbi:energy transducer TonB [Rheinheimera sp. 4Y26]|uniref:energy transducer TonB n=1 Tax=Rheinheimera sp. 4Y26 TaxID=2977811 RepID=UPI0021B0BA67|nr:energy transducer TonB [Rheinheimera sp. 4Y26]MCT6699801.1 energy transducer TonB [Rheinheimera sp. 4Y26]